MIKFQTLNHEIDLTNKGIRFKENSDYFSGKISKNFSFPFNVDLDGEIAQKLGLVNVENVRSYKSKVYGFLIKDTAFYDAYISINQIKGDKAELTLFYGKEVDPVFDKKLSELPFPVVLATGGLPAFAKSQITKSWPDATHNFVKVFREELSEKSNYKHFENFVNNYVDNSGTWEFPENSIDLIDAVSTVVNRNVMCPMPYLMEVLRVIYKSAGLELRGDFVNDEFNKKIVLVTKNFMEQFSVSQFDHYNFGFFSRQETVNNKTINVYRKVHTPNSIGSYSLKMRVSMSNAIAKYFKLTVKQAGIILYTAFSENKQVNIDTTLDINIVNTSVFSDIEVELHLSYQENTISSYNDFTYEYKEGQLNLFPSVYTLSDFLPNMKVREFVNRIKTWLNLKFDYTPNAVYINYLENIDKTIVFADNSHLEQPDPQRILNSNNLFVLKYPNEEEILVSNVGQVYDKTDYVDDETETIDLQVLPLKVTENYGSVTAVYPEDEEDIMLALYDGTIAAEPLATAHINNRKLDLQHIFDLHYKKWLKFRSNSETYKDSFFMHVSEKLDIQSGVMKYNKKFLIKSISKKRVNEEYWKVDVECESY